MNWKRANSQILKYIFLSGLFIGPFVFWPQAAIPYEIPRVWFVLRWTELMAVFALIGSLFFLKEAKKDTRLVVLVGLFTLSVLISSFFGADFTKSLWGNYYRADGLFTLFHLIGLFFILVLFWEKSWQKGMFLAISSSAIIVSVLAIMFKLTTFGQPNFLAGYLAISLPFIGYFIEKSKRTTRYLWVGAAFLVLFAMITTDARGALLASGVYFAGWFLLQRGISRKKLLLLILICLIPIVFFFWFQFRESTEFVAEGRGRIVTKGFLAFAKKPILGWGWANFDYAFDAVEWPFKMRDDVYVDRAHSSILEVLVTTGLIGFIFYGGILIRLFQRLTNDTFSKTLFLAMVVLIIHAQTNIISIAEEIIFWIILGIAASKKL